MIPCNHPRATGRLLTGLVSILLLSFVLLAGCGGGDGKKSEDTIVLATVGDMEITADMYKAGLLKLEAADLPRDENGQQVDTSTLGGKEEFLQILINKELLAKKAYQLGYDKDPQAVSARASLMAYESGMALWEDVVASPANSISEEELQAFYAKMGTARSCQFVITNFLEDAEKARDFAMTGADWEEVVAKYHDGAPAPQGKYQIKVPYGQYSSSFEDVVFDAPIGGITEPAPTSYGFWVMRVLSEKQGNKPSLEDAKAQILDVTRNRKAGRTRNEFKEELRLKYKLVIDEDVLWICYLGLPEGGMMDPETNQPKAKDSLEPLNVPLDQLGRIFYSYEKDGELVESTLGDYKGHFDNMNVFQRPKRSDMLGGLREHIIQELERGFVDEEAEARGFHEDPAVLAKVNEKVEEVMVTKLYADVVVFDERVTPEDADAFYTEHITDYMVPELRSGLLAICLNEAEAAKAKVASENGQPWRGTLKEFDIDKENKARGGKLDDVPSTGTGPVRDAFFSLEIGQLSEPFALENGRYGLVKLESIKPAHQIEKTEVMTQMGQRIQAVRKEDAFKALLTKWSAEFGVTEYPENLEDLPSWEVVHTPVVPENLVPRN